jgi:hypothetical protein
MSTNKIETDHETRIPTGGTLGLLALGYRGLEAWREARGREWIEARRAEWEAGKAAEAARKAADAARKAAQGDTEAAS